MILMKGIEVGLQMDISKREMGNGMQPEHRAMQKTEILNENHVEGGIRSGALS